MCNNRYINDFLNDITKQNNVPFIIRVQYLLGLLSVASIPKLNNNYGDFSKLAYIILFSGIGFFIFCQFLGLWTSFFQNFFDRYSKLDYTENDKYKDVFYNKPKNDNFLRNFTITNIRIFQ